MASRINTSSKEVQVVEFLNLSSKVRIKDFVDSLKGIMEVESIPTTIIEEIVPLIFSVVHSYLNKYKRIKTPFVRKQFREASKRHQRTLNNVLLYIVQGFSSSGLKTKIILQNHHILVEANYDILINEEIKPHSFIRWYRMLNIFTKIEQGMTLNQVITLCRILTSVFNIVNEPKLTQSEKDEQTDEYLNLVTKSEYSSIENFKDKVVNKNPKIQQRIDDLIETVRLIKVYMTLSTRDIPKWALDIVIALNALKRNRQLFLYDNNRPSLSANSSCSKFKYKNKMLTIPGLFASCIEPDYFKEEFPKSNFDSITGFNQEYILDSKINEYINFTTKRRYSSVIGQKKPKIRVIHPLNNSEQDRLEYYQILISYVLRRIPSDCTFDQSKGPNRIISVMTREKDKSIYSLDLSNATDTFNIGLQYLIIRDLIFSDYEFDDELSSDWLNIMTSQSYIKLRGKEVKFKFLNGQPQGFLSSFPSFALEHHIVMLTVLRLSGLEYNPRDFYNCLGDDGDITAVDRDLLIPNLYVEIANAANVNCNLQKGYLYNPDYPEYRANVAEFAKCLIIDGFECTPIPTKLLVTQGKVDDQIALAAWYSQHRFAKWSIENLKYFLKLQNPILYHEYSGIIDILVHLSVPSIFRQCFENKLERFLDGFSNIDIAILQDILAHSIVYAACDKIIGGKGFQPNITNLLKLTSELKIFTKLMRETTLISKNNKLSVMHDNLLNKVQVFQEICRNYSTLSDLDSETIEIICMVLQTDNEDKVKEQVSSVLDAIDLLTLDPNQNAFANNMQLADKLLKSFKDFSISVVRSWSSFQRKVPLSYLDNLISSVNSLLNKEGKEGINMYVAKHNMLIEPMIVFDTNGDKILENDEYIFQLLDDSPYLLEEE